MSNEFPGSDVEKLALWRAVRANCGCQYAMGRMLAMAGCHQLLQPDRDCQNKWKRLIFMRRQAGRLLVEELGPQTRWTPGAVYTPKDLAFIIRRG